MSVTKMSDSLQNQTQLRFYRYTIPELIALSATAYLGFDLSKFTYEAARAGVIPSLGDCAMSSRKSSASISKAANADTTGASDLPVFTGARPVQPNRQPHLPPPIERQKDEGFAKFLKKHSSPTHNRVTAGGRIVPIEPRSPPPFDLSATAVNRPQVQPADQVLQKPTKQNADSPWTTNTSFGQFFGANGLGGFNANGNRVHNISSLTNGPRHAQMQYASSFGNHTGIASSVSPETMPSQPRLVGGPVMPSAMFGQQSTMIDGMQGAMSNFGISHSMIEPHANEGVVDFNQQMAQSYATQQGPTAFQTLMAWEQHYAQLDQQLKDIDRHRAMSNLDPRLAEQRRVIVQQRSDAKDTVRDLQAMLGVRRRFESSQDSWNPSFNVDAPVYVPQNTLTGQGDLGHKPSLEAKNAGIIEKPHGRGQRRAIPIIPPPDHNQNANANRSGLSSHPSREGSLTSEKSSSQSGSSVPQLEPKSSASSNQLQACISVKSNHSAADKQRSDSSGNVGHLDQQASSGNGEQADSQDLDVIIPPNNVPPRNLPEEYMLVIEAINRPKGTLSKVRLLDNRVMDVEGQGLGLLSSPTAMVATTETSNSAINSEFNGHVKSTTTLHQYNPHVLVGKENVSVIPKGHQKAATDAFLAQYNVIDDSMSFGINPETQSLRLSTASNSHLRSYEQDTSKYYHQGLRSLASRENMPQLSHQRSVGGNKHGMVYSVNDEKVFEGSAGDYVDSDALNTKGYSVTSVQNVHAIRSLPNSFDGAVEARQTFQAQLSAASKSRSPRFLRRFGANGGA